MSKTNITPDLTQRPPRSPRVQLGGYVILPRMLDKGRALLAGKNGEYHYACPMDKHFLSFTGIDPEALKTELAKGGGDWEILNWIQANAKQQRQPWEIAAWSEYHLRRTPDGDTETLEYFTEQVKKLSSVREDVRTWFDYLDLDDYCSFGGKA
ncbi:MAG TPA: DUF5069 domain-containing protein [Verrucomicrobiae bacterium]|nr:DUF5069 domain-containing protein [Verrucomicrobiae bacterium]